MLVPVRDPNGECQSGNVGKERGAEVEVRVAIQRKVVQGLKYARNKNVTQASNPASNRSQFDGSFIGLGQSAHGICAKHPA